MVIRTAGKSLPMTSLTTQKIPEVPPCCNQGSRDTGMTHTLGKYVSDVRSTMSIRCATGNLSNK